MKKSMESMIINIYGNMNNVFLEEENKNTVMEINKMEINEEFFIATLIAFKIQFKTLTGQEMDLIDFTHLLNKLAIQFIMDDED